MIIFCGIGLPGYAVSIALPVIASVAVMLASILLDKVSHEIFEKANIFFSYWKCV